LGFAGSFRIVSSIVGRRGQSVKCRRIWPLVSLAPQPHPHGNNPFTPLILRVLTLSLAAIAGVLEYHRTLGN
jgi:hypothetical protein